ncbi:MAG: hypothetical protein LBE82_00740 [Chitinophagaceae bacterium]|nr:hypothetical protein [Chitinophagaceae bacterium]
MVLLFTTRKKCYAHLTAAKDSGKLRNTNGYLKLFLNGKIMGSQLMANHASHTTLRR